MRTEKTFFIVLNIDKNTTILFFKVSRTYVIDSSLKTESVFNESNSFTLDEDDEYNNS